MVRRGNVLAKRLEDIDRNHRAVAGLCHPDLAALNGRQPRPVQPGEVLQLAVPIPLNTRVVPVR
jgi:hypothetical protein